MVFQPLGAGLAPMFSIVGCWLAGYWLARCVYAANCFVRAFSLLLFLTSLFAVVVCALWTLLSGCFFKHVVPFESEAP